jgi:hypothetical protein
MSSFTPFLKLEKPVNNDQTWGDAVRLNVNALDYAMAHQRVMFVDPHYTTSNLYPGAGAADSERRRWDTIDGAITAAEAAGWDEYLILVANGSYAENLTITKGVTIAAMCGPSGGFYPGPVRIGGQNTVEAPVITVSPADSDYVYVQLIGIGIENAFRSAVGGEISTPYAIQCDDQAAYSGTRNRLILRDCYVRMQTWGQTGGAAAHVWTYGIKAVGNWHVICEGTSLTALAYGGGYSGGGQGIVRRIFDVRGNDAMGQTSLLNLKRCDIDNASYDDGTAPILFYMDDRAQLYVSHSSTPFAVDTMHVNGGTGTQIIKGVTSSDWLNYMNAVGVSGTVVL